MQDKIYTYKDIAKIFGCHEKTIYRKIKEVREAVNALESAIYDLVEPFEDALRTAECDYDELEMDMEELAEAV